MWWWRLTTGADGDRLLHPLLLLGGHGHGDEEHHAQAGAHPQAGGGLGVALAAVRLAELQRGHRLLGLPVDAGHAGAAGAAEGVLPALCCWTTDRRTGQSESERERQREREGRGRGERSNRREDGEDR